ncbi:MAG TPA: hypothetical protein VK249_01465 [Anaerolineales bacterium]|nr:hypothetical protein [Anaerolineales bacterium]
MDSILQQSEAPANLGAIPQIAQYSLVFAQIFALTDTPWHRPPGQVCACAWPRSGTLAPGASAGECR